MSDPADANLVRSCREGDRRAQLALVEIHQGPVFQVSLRILGNREDAADATQATFLKVFERLDQYDAGYRLFSWIYRIAVNEAIDQLKRARPHDELPDDLLSGAIGPEGNIDADRVSRALKTGLHGLPEDYRVALVLRHFSDCSYDEIAMIVGVPEKTVKSRIHSARQLLRERLLAQGIRPG
jgi:RNA polymerase sigma-70 factor (ECF subfamily)